MAYSDEKQSNVGTEMIPHKDSCRCDECELERLRDEREKSDGFKHCGCHHEGCIYSKQPYKQ